MAIKRTAPTNPRSSDHPILVSKQATYSLPKKSKPTSPSKPETQTLDQLSFIKKDLLTTLVVSILILGVIFLAVSRIN